MGGAGALANIKVHVDQDWWPAGPIKYCKKMGCCGTPYEVL